MSVNSTVTHSVSAKAFVAIKITCRTPNRNLNATYVLNTGMKFEQWKAGTKLILYLCCKCALSGVDAKIIVRENWQSPHKISESSAGLPGNRTHALYFSDFHFFSWKRSIGQDGKIHVCRNSACVCSILLACLQLFFIFFILEVLLLAVGISQWVDGQRLGPWNWIFEQIILAHELRHI